MEQGILLTEDEVKALLELLDDWYEAPHIELVRDYDSEKHTKDWTLVQLRERVKQLKSKL